MGFWGTLTEYTNRGLGTIDDVIGDAVSNADDLWSTLRGGLSLYHEFFPPDSGGGGGGGGRNAGGTPTPPPATSSIPWGTLVMVGGGMLMALLLVMAIKG